MKEYIGIKSWLHTELDGSLKREALMFHRVCIHKFYDLIHLAAYRNNVSLIQELHWLCEKGIVLEPDETESDAGLSFEDEFRGLEDLGWEKFKSSHEIYKQKIASGLILDAEEAVDDLGRLFYENACQLRQKSIELRSLHNVDIVPILHPTVSFIGTTGEAQTKKDNVVGIVLNALPVPDEVTPWEQILEYRSDPDSIVKFLALKNWMNDVARQELSPNEIEEKLEWLIHSYKKHLELHRLKSNSGTLETIIVAGAEFIESLIKFKWSAIAKGLFAFKRRRIALLEGELTLPGNEVAYIIDAQERLSGK